MGQKGIIVEINKYLELKDKENEIEKHNGKEKTNCHYMHF